jgi:hypothetical protein
MRKISHSVRRAKQAKFWLLTVPVRTVRTDTCQSVQLTWQRPYSDVASSEDDAWQTVRRTRGITRTRHVSYGFGTFGMRFDQYGGDTCHHSQGDTWHG